MFVYVYDAGGATRVELRATTVSAHKTSSGIQCVAASGRKPICITYLTSRDAYNVLQDASRGLAFTLSEVESVSNIGQNEEFCRVLIVKI